MRNHGVSRIHRPSTDHRSVFDLGLSLTSEARRAFNLFAVALNPLLMLGQQFGPLVLRNLDSLERHTVAYVGFAPRSSRHSIASAGPVASWGWWAVEEIWPSSASRIRRDRCPRDLR